MLTKKDVSNYQEIMLIGRTSKLLKAGFTAGEIADMLHRPRRQVNKWVAACVAAEEEHQHLKKEGV